MVCTLLVLPGQVHTWVFFSGRLEENKSASGGCTQTAGSLNKGWWEGEVLEPPSHPVVATGGFPVRVCVFLSLFGKRLLALSQQQQAWETSSWAIPCPSFNKLRNKNTALTPSPS